MASDDLGPFAQLPPMKADFEASVGIDRVWVTVFEVLERFERRRDAIMALTGIDETAGWLGNRLPELIGRATAVALQQCIERDLISIYVFNGQSGRFHRLPKEGLVSPFIGVTLIGGQETSARAAHTSETSWTTGTLFEIDCDQSLFRLARERVPLMTSEAEASATIEAFQAVLEREAGQAEFEPLPSAEPAARAAWISGLIVRERWPLREALLWIATRDLDDMADIVLTSLWRDDDQNLGPPGLSWVLGHIDAWRDDRTFVSSRPDVELLQALKLGQVQASGLYEDREQRQHIKAFHWEDLELGTCPAPRSSGSAARRKSQVHGIAWTGHWTDLLFERADLFAAFAPDGPGDQTTAQRTSDKWEADYLSRPRWTLGEVLAWVAFRTAAGPVFGPDGWWPELLKLGNEFRLGLLLSAIENEHDAKDRFPRHALERAIQRQGLLAAEAAAGEHMTHRLENLLAAEFWREDILAHFPRMDGGDATTSISAAGDIGSDSTTPQKRGGIARGRALAAEASLWKAKALQRATQLDKTAIPLSRTSMATKIIGHFNWSTPGQSQVEAWLKTEAEAPSGPIRSRARARAAS